MTIKCLIVDDDALYRQGLRRLLAENPEIEVIAEANDAIEALTKVRELRPDIVLMSVGNPGTPGLEVARVMVKDSPCTHLIFLALEEEENLLLQCMDVGALGYILKDAPASRLLTAIYEVYQGRKYLSPQVLGRLVDDFRSRQETRGQTQGATLTPREREVLKLIAQGNSVKEIAHLLGLSVKTIEAHKFNLMRKLDIHNKAQLVIYAIQKKILEMPTGT